jgi:hypothetical protein
MERDGILIFHSIHKVMRAEKVLKTAGFDVRLMPVPRDLSSDCGLSLCFPFERMQQVVEELDADGCPAAELHRLSAGRYDRIL